MAELIQRNWSRIGLGLVMATMVYNVLEAVVAIGCGARAGSIALVGFGLDSVIECAAAGALLWRLRVDAAGVDPKATERTEHRVHRFVGATFLGLALYVSAQAAWMLWAQAAPAESAIGIALAVASLLVMPAVAWGKLRAAREIGSAALRSEAKETLACSYLSGTLLLGLGANAVAGWWWADPAAALLMVPWLLKEGREGIGAEVGCS
jgi:divalent metal cation (Fe/Co/Zn/Cd) transporter